MQQRTIASVVYAAEHDMGPLKVRQPLPSAALPYLDPFVLLHHAGPRMMDGHQGVEAHPHRGFAPVTFIFQGAIRHRDSRGNDSTIAAGGTQWMHAGSGIVHEEMPLAGELELIQLWINSPARHKTDAPSYHPLTREETPSVAADGGLLTMHVIAGELLAARGPIPTLTPINAATIDAREGGRLYVPLPRTHHAFVYVLHGNVRFGGDEVVTGFHQAVFNTNGDGIQIEALAPTRALLLSGEPIDEQIVSYGPFVMNTEEEIRAAFRDYRSGAMGAVS